jgi:hypothetical protein
MISVKFTVLDFVEYRLPVFTPLWGHVPWKRAQGSAEGFNFVSKHIFPLCVIEGLDATGFWQLHIPLAVGFHSVFSSFLLGSFDYFTYFWKQWSDCQVNLFWRGLRPVVRGLKKKMLRGRW